MEAAVVVFDAHDPKVLEQMNENERTIAQAEMIEVSCMRDYELADAFVKAVASEEKRRRDYFKPFKQRAKQVHSDWVAAEAQSVDGLATAKTIVSKKMSKWYAEEQRKKAEEERKAKEAAEAVGADPSAVIVQGPAVGAGTGVSGQAEYWVYEIVDASQIPREYMIPNETKIAGVVRALKGDTNIPGVKAVKQYRRTR